MLSCAELIAKIKIYNQNCDETLLQKAYLFAKNAHGGQKRHSGESYFSHPVAVAEILCELRLDDESIISALLHDVLEDTEVKLEEIQNLFGSQVAYLVEGLTKFDKLDEIRSIEMASATLRKLVMAMSWDIRVLLVKLADRLHNLRTLSYLPSLEKKLKKATESLEIYAPLAGRIGLGKIKDEIEDLAFAVIEPGAYAYIATKLSEIKAQNENLILQIIAEFESLFAQTEFPCLITGRQKKPYSIWLKMKRKNIGFQNLHDVMAFRCIVDDWRQCYQALGIINSHFKMVPNSFTDYISMPKENGYQSLHLTSIGPLGKKIEVQIRDKIMHEVADFGVASHWFYKEKNKNFNSESANFIKKPKYLWISELVSIFENAKTSGEIVKASNLNLAAEEVFCFTPAGEAINLAIGSTIVDFAYAIHSEIGNHCYGARVNGVMTPLNHRIENGDQIEIITDKSAKPTLEWLRFVNSSRSKSAIRAFIRHEKSAEFKNLGRAILQKYFQLKELEFNDELIAKTLRHFNKKSLDDLFCKVAEGNVGRYEIAKECYPDFVDEKIVKSSSANNKALANLDMEIDGVAAGMAVNFASCCKPIFGDPIIGVINVGIGVVAHHQLCQNLQNLAINSQKIVDLCWKENAAQGQTKFRNTQIRVIVANKSGALADITNVIASRKINISHIKTTGGCHETFEVQIDIEVQDIQQLQDLLSAIRISNHTILVERLASAL